MDTWVPGNAGASLGPLYPPHSRLSSVLRYYLESNISMISGGRIARYFQLRQYSSGHSRRKWLALKGLYACYSTSEQFLLPFLSSILEAWLGFHSSRTGAGRNPWAGDASAGPPVRARACGRSTPWQAARSTRRVSPAVLGIPGIGIIRILLGRLCGQKEVREVRYDRGQCRPNLRIVCRVSTDCPCPCFDCCFDCHDLLPPEMRRAAREGGSCAESGRAPCCQRAVVSVCYLSRRKATPSVPPPVSPAPPWGGWPGPPRSAREGLPRAPPLRRQPEAGPPSRGCRDRLPLGPSRPLSQGQARLSPLAPAVRLSVSFGPSSASGVPVASSSSECLGLKRRCLWLHRPTSPLEGPLFTPWRDDTHLTRAIPDSRRATHCG